MSLRRRPRGVARGRMRSPAICGWRAIAAMAVWLMAVAGVGWAQAPDDSHTRAADANTFTGLARAPETNLYVGTATTSIPIQLPPGRKNLTPQLALTYTSGGGPSPYGYGWDLPLGRIQRSSKHGVLTCGNLTHAEDFVLMLPGASVEFIRDPATGRGIPRVAESFFKIVQNGDAWDVWDTSGIKYTFGSSPNARTGNDPIDLYHADSCQAPSAYDPLYTFSWELTRIEDPNGNRIDIEYLPDVNLAPPDGDGVAYPRRLLYGGNSAGLAHQFEVDFIWSDDDQFSRPPGDRIINAMGGFAAQLTKLLSRIVVRYPVGGSVVRWYGVDYEFDVGTPRRGRQSFLSAVTLYDGGNQALARYDGQPAATTFLYAEGDIGFSSAAYQAGASLSGYGRKENHGDDYAYTVRDVFDINGDGFPDLIDTQACNPAASATRRWAVTLGSVAGFRTPVVWDFNIAASFMCHIRDDRVTGGSLRHRWGLIDTLDINGDGIPDWIDSSTWTASTPYWKVYLGYVTATGGGFQTTPLSWSAPLNDLRHVYTGTNIGGGGFRGGDGSVTLRDLVDLNGDGLPDLVQTPDVGQSGPWTVWMNTGSGFEAVPRLVPAAFPMLRWTRNHDFLYDEVLGLYDMNGDGLPDLVFAPPQGPWLAYVNTGLRLDSLTQQWTVPAPLDDQWLRRPDARELFDINGDGLPDLVDTRGYSSSGNSWQVVLNHGGGFATGIQLWPAPWVALRTQVNNGTTVRDFFDVDGDGLVDFVDFAGISSIPQIYFNRGGAWCASANGVTCAASGIAAAVAPNPNGVRPDVLVRMENGVGGTTALEYRPSTQWDNTGGDAIPDLPLITWTLTRIERDDGLCDATGNGCVTGGSHQLITDMTYMYGRFDAADRVFRGFQIVSAIDGGVTSPVRQGRTTYFHQTAALGGKVREVQVYDASGGGTFATQPLSRTVNTWECADPTTGAALGTCPAAPGGDVWARLQGTVQQAYTSFQLALSRATVRQTLAWHQCGGKFYGNASHTVAGDGAALQVHTLTDYACLDNSAAYIVDRPTHVSTSGTGPPLEEKWFFYDGLGSGGLTRGNLTRVESWLDQWTGSPASCSAVGKQCVATRTEYDAYGNVRRVTDALGRITDTQYDALALYPSVVTGPPPFSQKKATAYDPACGVLLWETIAYTGSVAPAERTRRRYDSFCRLIRTALPDEDVDAAPHQELTYVLGGPQQPTVVTTRQRETGNALGYTYAHTFSDALGRVLQQTGYPAIVDGVAGTVSRHSVTFDARGNPDVEYAPFFISGVDPVSLRSPPANAGATRRAYDALGRTTRVTNPDGSSREMHHAVAWQTWTMDECYTDPACTGGKTLEVRDALGRVVEKRVYEEYTFKTRTVYGYDALGRLTSTTQGSGETTLNVNTTATTVYDTLGRRIQFVDPDSGTWRYGYDAVGNLLYQDDPKANQHVQFCYDALNRVSLECPRAGDYQSSGSIQSACGLPCSSDEVRYTYGTSSSPTSYALGRLVRVADPSGQTAFDRYDVRGRMLQTTKVVDTTGDGQAVTTATSRYVYDVADHLAQIIYPDAEVVDYAYDGAGQLRGMWSETHGEEYLSALTYDVFGRPRVIAHGNGVTDTRAYSGKDQRYRPVYLLTQGPEQTYLLYFYMSYSPTGLLTRRTDYSPYGAGGAMDDSATFTYDGLGRLIRANGPQLGDNNYQYDPLGNLTSKEGMSLAYLSTRPHTLQRINGSASGLSHDANGNREGKPGQQYTYDKKDRLSAVGVGTGQTVTFRYDYTGRRVAKVVDNGAAPDTVTAYYSELMEASGGWVTKYYFAGSLLVATRREHNAMFAAAAGDAVSVAATSMLQPRVVLLLRRDAQLGVILSAVVLTTAILLVPGRRRRRGGFALRRGHAIGITVAFSFTTLPWPLVVRPDRAEAQCGPPPALVYHYHLDHLGSTQLITNESGAPFEYVRYKPYGEIRARFNGNGSAIPPSEVHRYEFTGYESELLSSLQYAGARFYDPALGLFLTHDPAHQFPNPYSYGGGDPINGADPGGAIFGIDDIVFVIIVAAAFAASAIDAGVKTGSVGEAFKAGAIGAAVAVATAAIGYYVVAPVAETALSPPMQQALKLAAVGTQAYGGADAFRKGNIASGMFGAVLTAYGVANLGTEPEAPLRMRTSADADPLALANHLSAGSQTPSEMEVGDLRPADVLLTGDGGSAQILRANGDYGHAALITETSGPLVTVLSSDQRGLYIATNADPAIGGRTWDVFRLQTVDPSKVQSFVQGQAIRGGFLQYVGNRGGNVCASVVARAVEAGGGPAVPRLFDNFVTPNALAGAYGPPIGRIKMPLLSNP